MSIANYIPVWNKLTEEQKKKLTIASFPKKFPKGTVVHKGSLDCTGLLLIRSGQLRAYSLSEEGREVTLYRLFEQDVCLFSASCIMNSIQFEMMIEAEKDTEVYVILPDTYKQVMAESAPLANYTNELMAARFSEVMWLIEQIMWKSLDKRVASFLIEESLLEGSTQLKITHEAIANHLGTHREVVTRMLKYFQSEGLVKVTRGAVEIVDQEGLETLGER